MTAEQASDLKLAIFDQLDQFDASPPFTIQRLAELCSAPRAHYAAAGKYLRALERAILVTSGTDAFPALPVEARAPLRPEDEIGAAMPSAGAALSTPTTPRRMSLSERAGRGRGKGKVVLGGSQLEKQNLKLVAAFALGMLLTATYVRLTKHL